MHSHICMFTFTICILHMCMYTYIYYTCAGVHTYLSRIYASSRMHVYVQKYNACMRVHICQSVWIQIHARICIRMLYQCGGLGGGKKAGGCRGMQVEVRGGVAGASRADVTCGCVVHAAVCLWSARSSFPCSRFTSSCPCWSSRACARSRAGGGSK